MAHSASSQNVKMAGTIPTELGQLSQVDWMYAPSCAACSRPAQLLAARHHEPSKCDSAHRRARLPTQALRNPPRDDWHYSHGGRTADQAWLHVRVAVSSAEGACAQAAYGRAASVAQVLGLPRSCRQREVHLGTRAARACFCVLSAFDVCPRAHRGYACVLLTIPSCARHCYLTGACT